jgi:hypothetical protein
MNLFLLTETERGFSRTGFLKVEMDKIFTGKITMTKTLGETPSVNKNQSSWPTTLAQIIGLHYTYNILHQWCP